MNEPTQTNQGYAKKRGEQAGLESRNQSLTSTGQDTTRLSAGRADHLFSCRYAVAPGVSFN
jgi:hypothetical protein